MTVFYSFITSILISIVLTPVLMRYAKQLHMIDEPGGRKVHEVAIPRCGGIGLAVGTIVAMLLFVPFQTEIIGLISGGTIILLFGLLDDRYELSYKWKFFGQFIAVVAVVLGGILITHVPFNGLEQGALFITLPLTIFFSIGVINAVNLSDGLDGLAAGIMLLSFCTIAFLAIEGDSNVVAIIALAVAGGIVGFLWFNTHPAVVFMGDTGSQFIGYMAVFLVLHLTQIGNQALNPALPLLILGLPILDTLTVMISRIKRGQSPFSPDKTHIHHKLLVCGFTHAEAVAAIYVAQGVFLASAIYFRYASDLLVIGMYVAISLSILMLLYWAGQSKWLLHNTAENDDRRGRGVWRNLTLFKYCRHYINISLALFLVTQMYCLVARVQELPLLSHLIMLVALLFYMMLPRMVQDVWVRFSLYVSAIFANIMGQDFPEMLIHTHWGVDFFLLVLIVVVTMAIRITRKNKFRLTTQDLLVVLFLIASILLVDFNLLDEMIFRLFCLVYALEYLLHRDIYQFRMTRYMSAISGIVIVMLVYPTML